MANRGCPVASQKDCEFHGKEFQDDFAGRSIKKALPSSESAESSTSEEDNEHNQELNTGDNKRDDLKFWRNLIQYIVNL